MEIKDLLEEISEEEIEEVELIEVNWEEMEEGVSKCYNKLCEWEGFLFMEKRKMLEIYYEFGKKFEEKLDNLLDEVYNEKFYGDVVATITR